jgi:adenylate kinase family enzyme
MKAIAVIGASPGIGKSTLCSALARQLTSAGLRVHHFEEERLFAAAEFAPVAAQFRRDGTVDPDDLVEGTGRYLDHLDGEVDVAILDALLPFVPTLLALGYPEPAIDAVIDALAARVGATRIHAVFLDGDPAAALTRAIERENDGWIDRYGEKLARYGLVPADPGRGDLCAYLQRERDVTIRVLRRQPWPLLVVADADRRPADEILRAVTDFATVP